MPNHQRALDAYLDKIDRLPPTPTVLIQLLALFRNPDVDVDDIVRLLRRDPALSAEVLRQCNNSFLGKNSKTEDVNEAVYRLGFYEVYKIVVTLFGLRALTAKDLPAQFPTEGLRRHSSIAAIAAGTLAKQVGLSEGVAFTSALLHDLGKLVLALTEGDRYVLLLGECKRMGSSLSKVETQTLGFNHAEIGARLLHRWGVPEEIVLPVRVHSNSEIWQPLPNLIQGASDLASHLEAGSGGYFSATPEGKRLIRLFELETHAVNGWEYQVRSQVTQLGSLTAAGKPR